MSQIQIVNNWGLPDDTPGPHSMIWCDFDQVAGSLPQVDLIYTDPPYPRAEAVPCFRLLSKWAHQLLKDGGSLVTIVPHYLLEEAVTTLSGAGLKYRWIYNMDQEAGPHPRLAMGVEVCWKPILHYVKRAYPQHKGFLRDKVAIPGPEKGLHEWQQAEAWAEYYIQKLCPPGGTVLDPFCGPGTVPAVCARLGLNWVGVERDQDTYHAAEQRIQMAYDCLRL